MKKKIAIQGELGSYSHLATSEIFKDAEIIPCKTFDDVFDYVSQNKGSLTVIPIENTIAGRVADVHYLIPKYQLKIIGEHFHVVNHCLIANPESDLKNIQYVVSHAHALGQCKKKIKKYKLIPIVAADTAGSAKLLSEEPDLNRSVIASKLAAKIYGLKILEENLEDYQGNTTRFLVMQSDGEKAKFEKNKKYITSCIFKLKSIPAALFNALGGFAKNNVNLTKLESFTVNNSFDQVFFYLDIEGHPLEDPVKKSLNDLKKQTETINILGVYLASKYRFKK